MATNAKNLAELLNTDSTVAVGDIADGSVTTVKLADDAVTNAKIGANAVGTTEVADGAVTFAKTTDVSGLVKLSTVTVASGSACNIVLLICSNMKVLA